MLKRLFLLGACALIAAPAAAPAATRKIDPTHSSVTFSIRHLVSKVPGRFDEFSGTVEYDPAAPTQAKVEATITAASINTKAAKRDEDLRSANFFDVATYPTITFKSTGVEKAEKGLKVLGDLTMHGVTKPVTLEVEVLGTGTHPFNPKAQVTGFSARTKVNRQDFVVEN
jgi:polyisoprenoid-binding protein YceI